MLYYYYPTPAYRIIAEATAVASGISKGWIVSNFAISYMIKAFQIAVKLTRQEKATSSVSAKHLATEEGISEVCNSLRMPYSSSMSIDFTEHPNRERAIRHNMMIERFAKAYSICEKMIKNKDLYMQKRIGAPVWHTRNDILAALEVFEDKAMEAMVAIF